jgi:hypothetical protein
MSFNVIRLRVLRNVSHFIIIISVFLNNIIQREFLFLRGGFQIIKGLMCLDLHP